MAPIAVRPDQLLAVAQFLREHGNRIQTAVQAIDDEMRRMNADAFAGHSADILRARYNALQQRLMSFAPMLNKFAAQLDEAAAAFRKADAENLGTASGPSGASSNWQMAPVASSESGMGSMEHIRAIQEANRAIKWTMW